MSLTISADLSALDSMLDDLGDAVEAAVRPAAQAAAQVLYDEVKANVAQIGTVTGNLQSAVYQAYATHESSSGKAVYNISWNARKAPHGGLLEYGHLQRYVTYVGSDGHWYTAIRSGVKGRPKPKRHASQAVKDAYYVLLQGGPKQVAAQPFIRPATSKFDEAMEAAKAELFKQLDAIK